MEAQIEPIESMRYDITRQFSQPDEVLQQHVVNVVTKDGAHFRVDAAVYFRFDNGLITRIEEYASPPCTDQPGTGRPPGGTETS